MATQDVRIPLLSTQGLPQGVPYQQLLDSLRGEDAEIGQLAEKIFAAVKKGPTAFTYQANGPIDWIADISFFLRSTFGATSNPPAFALAGLTTGANSFQGAVAAQHGAERTQEAIQLNDRVGIAEGAVDTVRGIFQSSGGAAFLGVRALTLASYFTHVETSSMQVPTLLGKATFLSGFIGTVLFGIFYAALFIWAMINVVELAQFTRKVFHKGEDPLQKLEKKLFVTSETVLKKYDRLETNAAISALEKIAVTEGAEGLDRLMSEKRKAGIALPSLNREQREGAIRYLFDRARAGNAGRETLQLLEVEETSRYYQGLVNNPLAIQGLLLSTLKLQAKRDRKVGRVLSSSLVEEIKTYVVAQREARQTGAAEEINRVASTRDPLLERIKSALKRNFAVSGSMAVFYGVLGIALTVISIVCPGAAIVIAVISAVIAISMLCIDGYGMYQSFQSGSQGTHDRKALLVHLALGIAATLGIVVLTIFTGGFVPLIVSLAIGLSWIIVDVIAHQKLLKKSKGEQDRGVEEGVEEAELAAETAGDVAATQSA